MIETISIFGREVSLYYTCWLLGVVAVFALGWYLRKDFELSFSKVTILVALDVIIGCLMVVLMSWISGGGKMNGFNFARVVIIGPLYYLPLAICFKVSFGKLSDLFAVIGALISSVSHLGCIFLGCCHGYPSNWGIYSNLAQTVCFPIQPIESALNFAIAVALFYMIKRKIQPNRLYMWYMVFFGLTRFFAEFYRDNEKIWYNVSELALFALVTFVVGVVTLAITSRFAKRSAGYEKDKI